MSQSFSYDLSVPGSPAEAQARLRDVVTEQMRQAARMRLASEDSNSLAFRPQWSWPLLVAIPRMVGGENVKLDFSAENGGTKVAVSGKVGGDAQKVASREFWEQTLSASE